MIYCCKYIFSLWSMLRNGYRGSHPGRQFAKLCGVRARCSAALSPRRMPPSAGQSRAYFPVIFARA